MNVRCKLTLVQKSEVCDYSRSHGHKRSTVRLGFQAVTGSDPESENAKFWSSTPTADIELIVEKARATEMELQEEFYLDLERIPQSDDVLTTGVGRRKLPAGCVGVFRVDSFTHEMGTIWYTGNDGNQQTKRGILVAMKLSPPHQRPPGDWPFLGGKVEFGCANMSAVTALELDKLYWANLLPAGPETEKSMDRARVRMEHE